MKGGGAERDGKRMGRRSAGQELSVHGWLGGDWMMTR